MYGMMLRRCRGPGALLTGAAWLTAAREGVLVLAGVACTLAGLQVQNQKPNEGRLGPQVYACCACSLPDIASTRLGPVS